MHSNSPSSTKIIPKIDIIPRHVAIIMDGNGRWAKSHLLPRVAGHKRGIDSVRAAVKACIERKVNYLTLFAFSSENWRRPAAEVFFLMQLFFTVLEQELIKLHENGIRFKVIGDLTKFEQVRKLKYSLCLTKLKLEKDRAEFSERLSKIK